MNPIFWPRVNYVFRHAMRPFETILPVDWQPRVNGTITVALDRERSIRLACNPTSFAAKRLFFKGTDGYEPETFNVLRTLAPDTDGFLDIGANLGYYSLICAAYNPEMTIKSFEPLPGPYHFLQKNIYLNRFDRIEPLQLALSSCRGKDTFYYTVDPTFTDLEHHLTSTGSLDRASAQQYANARSCSVEVETVDHYVSSELTTASIDLIKIDTESTEHLVLEGSTDVLETHRPLIICEVLPDASHEALQDIRTRFDYRLYHIERHALTRRDKLASTNSEFRNYLMVPEEKSSIVERVEKALVV